MSIDWNDFLSDEAKLRLPSVMSIPKSDDIITLGLGLPNPNCFPLKGIDIDVESPTSNFEKTERINRNIIDNTEKMIASCQYMSSGGLKFFHEWIKNYLEKYFKPSYDGWDHLIQAGSTQSLDSLFRLLINPTEDTILCETFTYSCFLETCKPFRINLISIEMDEFGVIPEKIDDLLLNWDDNNSTKGLKKPKIFYTMPTGHNPTGITMTIERRKLLLEVCNKHNILIIEDDPYYHLQLDNDDHIPSLLEFDTVGRVIRIDSFSKILMPGLRVSVVTCNKLFKEKLSMHNELSIHSASAVSQLILETIFTTWGDDGFKLWLNHLQSLYRRRRDVLLNAFDKFLPHDLVTYNRPYHGMFIWVDVNLKKFSKPSDSKLTDYEWAIFVEDSIFKVANEEYKVILAKGHWFMHNKESFKAGFRAAYSYATDDDMIKAAELFSKAIKGVYNDLYN